MININPYSQQVNTFLVYSQHNAENEIFSQDVITDVFGECFAWICIDDNIDYRESKCQSEQDL